MKKYLKKLLFTVALGVCDLGLWVANKVRLNAADFPPLPDPCALTPDKGQGGETPPPRSLPPIPVSYALSPATRKAEVFSAVLQGGGLDGAVVPVAEGVRSVALMLVENRTSGFVEAYERWDGRFERMRDGLVVGVYRWQMTVGKKKWGMQAGSGETRDASGE